MAFDLMFHWKQYLYKTIHLTANELYKSQHASKINNTMLFGFHPVKSRKNGLYTTMFVVSNSENINNLLDKLMELELTMPHVIVTHYEA